MSAQTECPLASLNWLEQSKNDVKGNEDDKIHHRRSLEDPIDPLIMIIDPNGDVVEEWKQTKKIKTLHFSYT